MINQNLYKSTNWPTTPLPRLLSSEILQKFPFSKPTVSAMNALLEEHYSKKPDKDHISSSSDDLVLIPGLPNHLSHLCLSQIYPSLLYSVSHSWRRFIYSPNFPIFFSLYALLSPSHSSNNRSIEFLCFDPISSKWDSLPCPPSNPPLQFLHRHPSFISRILPIQSLTVSGRLLLIAGTTDKFLPALDRPLGFDPLTKHWFFGPPLLTPRRWCITGAVDGAVCVVSGVGSHYRGDVARSIETWDMKKRGIEWNWEKMAELKDAIRFSREAIEAVGYKGKLCMVNVKGNAVKQGAIYDIGMNQWEKMPDGMLAGWNGPAAMDEDRQVIYSVDEAKGMLSSYDPENDCWEELIMSPEYLKGAEQIAAGRGRVCAVCGGGGGGGGGGGVPRIAVVDVVEKPARIWVVYPPQGMEVVAVHILPRMSHSDY